MSRPLTRMVRRWTDSTRSQINRPSLTRRLTTRLRLIDLEERSTPATFTVNSIADSGAGTLRQAILSANAANTDDVIVFDTAGVFGSPQTIKLTSAGLDTIANAGTLTIDASNVTGLIVDGNDAFRVFNVGTNAVVTMNGFTVQRGRVTNANGAGIRGSQSNITLESMVIRNNTATGNAFRAGAGGGIAFEGGADFLTLRNTTVTGNTADRSGAGIYFFQDGSFVIEGSTISGNQQVDGSTYYAGGAGIYFYGNASAAPPAGFTAGTLILRNSTVADNDAASSAGGLFTRRFNGVFLIENSTVSGNTSTTTVAYYGGGGVASFPGFAYPGTGTVLLENTIIGNNSGLTGNDILSHLPIDATHSLIEDSANGFAFDVDVANRKGIDPDLGPLQDNGGPTFTMAPNAGNTAVVNLGSNALLPAGLTSDQRGFGFVRSFGGTVDIGAVEVQPLGVPLAIANTTEVDETNLGETTYQFTVDFHDPTGLNRGLNSSTIGNANDEVRVTSNTGYNQLASFVSLSGPVNGEPQTATYSITIPAGWVATDSGFYTVSIEAGTILDLEGKAVPAGAVGGFGVGITQTFTVLNATDSDPDSLRDAMNRANASPADDIILFDPGVFSTAQIITLTSGSLFASSVSGGLTVTGPGENLLAVQRDSTAPDFRVIGSAAPDLELSGFTVMGGTDVAAGLLSLGNTTLDHMVFTGNPSVTGVGGLYVSGGQTVLITNSVISNNSAAAGSGGGMQVGAGAQVTMINSSVTNNTASGPGAGITVAGGGSLTLIDSVVADNIAGGVGGGIAMGANGSLTVQNSTISGNSGLNGGGIYFQFNGSLIVENSTISGNTATSTDDNYGGGGIYFFGTATTMQITNSTIANNTSASSGGGILLNAFSGTLLVRNSTIAGNTAENSTASQGGGGIAKVGATGTGSIILLNSIVADNLNPGGTAPDIRTGGTVTKNFSAVGSGDGFTDNGGTGNIPFGTPLFLGSLADNGGATLTIAPQVQTLPDVNPLIDAGSNGGVPGGFTTDQLGIVHDRIFGGTVDIGAYEVQATGVTVDLAAGQADPTNGFNPILFDIEFAVPVIDFTVDDITIGGTFAGNFDRNLIEISASSYQLELTNFDAGELGTIEVSVDADVAFDGSQTGNLASTGFAEVTVDTVAPDVTIDQDPLQDDPTNAFPITFNVSFTEDVTGFSFSDVSFNLGAGLTGIPTGTFAVIDDANYTVTVLGGITGQGTLTATILGGAATDAAGNGNAPSTSSDNQVTFDVVAPTVTINPTIVAPSVGGNSVSFNVEFSEPVFGLTSASFNTFGSTAPGLLSVGLSGTGPAYVVTVTGMVAGGTVVLNLPAAAVEDEAGNDSAAPTGDNDVVFVNSGTLQFSGLTYSQTEQGGLLATITVTRVVTAGVAEGSLSVDYATVVAGSTATVGLGNDYLASTGTLTFSPTDVSLQFTVEILEDSTVEGNETVNLALSNISVPGALGNPSTAVLNITDFEEGDFTFSSPTYTAAENGVVGSASIVINRVNGSDGNADVTYSLTLGSAEGSDIGTPTRAPGVVSFAAGETSKTIVIPITEDGLSEGFETVNFGLTGPTNGASLGAITAATLSIDPSDPIALGALQKYTVKLTDPVDGDIATVRLVGSKTGMLNVYLNDVLPTSNLGPISLLELVGTNPTTSVLTVSVAKARPINPAADGKMSVGGVRSVGANIGLRAFTAVKSDLDGTGIDLSGYLGVATVANVTNGADITAAASTINPRLKTTLNLGRVGNGTNITTGPINVLNTIEFGDGTITAPTIGRLFAKGTKLAPASAGNFGGDIVLSGATPLPNGVIPATMNLVKIAGSLLPTADIDVAGKVTSVLVGTAGGNLDVMDGSFEADSVVNITVFGNLTGDINVTGAGVANRKFALTNLKVLGANVRTGAVVNFVGGRVDGANIQVGSSANVGNVNTVTATRFINSSFFAGYTGLANGLGTFNNAGAAAGTVNSFSVTGRPNEIDAFANSNVVASTFKRVTLKTVDTTNAGAFGFTAGDAVVNLKVTTIIPAFSVLNLTTGSVSRDQFTVKVI